MMELLSIEGGLVVFIVGLIYKAADSHVQLRILTANDKLNKDRINDLENEQLSMTEALDRTYVSRDYVYENFINIPLHKQAMDGINKQFLTELKHVNETLQLIREDMKKAKQ